MDDDEKRMWSAFRVTPYQYNSAVEKLVCENLHFFYLSLFPNYTNLILGMMYFFLSLSHTSHSHTVLLYGMCAVKAWGSKWAYVCLTLVSIHLYWISSCPLVLSLFTLLLLHLCFFSSLRRLFILWLLFILIYCTPCTYCRKVLLFCSSRPFISLFPSLFTLTYGSVISTAARLEFI